SVDLLARVLLRPGEVAAVEEPGYPPVGNLLRSLGVQVAGVRTVSARSACRASVASQACDAACRMTNAAGEPAGQPASSSHDLMKVSRSWLSSSAWVMNRPCAARSYSLYCAFGTSAAVRRPVTSIGLFASAVP